MADSTVAVPDDSVTTLFDGVVASNPLPWITASCRVAGQVSRVRGDADNAQLIILECGVAQAVGDSHSEAGVFGHGCRAGDESRRR